MGRVTTRIRVENWLDAEMLAVGARKEKPRVVETDALVDTGASYSWIPREVLERLGAQPDEQRVFVLADGREVHYPIAWVRVKLGDRIQPTLVVFGDAGTEPLLGAFTLEGFGLGVDPVNRRLIPVPGLLKAAAA